MGDEDETGREETDGGAAGATVTAPSTTVQIIGSVTKIIVTLIDKICDRWVVIVVVGLLVLGHLGELAFDRGDPILLSSVGSAAAEIFGNSLFSIGGWLIAALLLIIGGMVLKSQQGRLRRQGAQLAALKDKQDPKRASSMRPDQIGQYVMKSRGGENPKEGDAQ